MPILMGLVFGKFAHCVSVHFFYIFLLFFYRCIVASLLMVSLQDDLRYVTE